MGKIGAGGVLAPMTAATVPAGAGVSAVTIDPTGHFLYATNRGDATISQFSIGVDGSLTPMASPTVPSGLHPTAIATGY
jgi:6-phosphogluconolactonase